MDDRLEHIGGAERLAVLADPTRLAILRRLMAGPATLTQIAGALGSYAAAVRHHVKRLESAGFVVLDRAVTVRNYTEKYYRASASAYEAHMLIVADAGAPDTVTMLGSHDLALEALAGIVNASTGQRTVLPVAIGSLDGLIAMRQGLADVVGCHLFDPEADDFNMPYVRHILADRKVSVVTLAHREQGLITATGNPLGIAGLEDLVRPGVRFVNRNPGSGTRVWLDHGLRREGLPTPEVRGYETVVTNHSDVAKAVESGQADVGLGIEAAAVARGLGFVPLFRERFDLVIDQSRPSEAVERLLTQLNGSTFGRQIRRFGGYDTTEMGHEVLASA